MTQKRLTLNKATVSLEQVSLTVTCPVCHKSYGVAIKRPYTRKNVGCLHGTFHVDVTPMTGVIQVDVTFERGSDNQVIDPPISASIEY